MRREVTGRQQAPLPQLAADRFTRPDQELADRVRRRGQPVHDLGRQPARDRVDGRRPVDDLVVADQDHVPDQQFVAFLRLEVVVAGAGVAVDVAEVQPGEAAERLAGRGALGGQREAPLAAHPDGDLAAGEDLDRRRSEPVAPQDELFHPSDGAGRGRRAGRRRGRAVRPGAGQGRVCADHTVRGA
jgi:hypothetical protein